MHFNNVDVQTKYTNQYIYLNFITKLNAQYLEKK